MLCIETSTSLGSLQNFEGAADEIKGAPGSRHPLISSPAGYPVPYLVRAQYLGSDVCVNRTNL